MQYNYKMKFVSECEGIKTNNKLISDKESRSRTATCAEIAVDQLQASEKLIAGMFPIIDFIY